MRLFILLFAVALVVAGIVYWSTRARVPADIVGGWPGNLDVSVLKVGMIVHIAFDSNGEPTASLSIPQQRIEQMPFDQVELDGRALKLRLSQPQVVYEGSVAADGQEITGTFTQNGVSLPLTLRPGDRPQLPNRPQEPQPPFPYRTEEVRCENPSADLTLAGTLTIPDAEGPFPAVVLITGSGPQDRDETVFGHKPFLVLADHLTRRGIAVLRLDNRGVGASTGTFNTATTKAFATDVLASVTYLLNRKEIRPDQIGLVGHSEGGIIAPMVAAKSKDVAFIVSMAGPAVTGEKVLCEQGAVIQRAEGIDEQTIAQSVALQEQMFAIIKEEQDPDQAAERLDVLVAQHPSHDGLEMQAKRLNTAWFRFFLSYDPVEAWQCVDVPVLAINGERDLQVSVDQNLPVIKKALEAAGNADYTITTLPGLNHFFQTCQTGSIQEYQEIEETFSPLALETISEWILARTSTSS